MSESTAVPGRGRLLLQGRSISRGPSTLEMIALGALGLVMVFAGYKIYASATDLNATAPTPAAYIPAFEATLDSTISASGSAAASQEMSLTFGTTGVVQEVLVDLGQLVRSGEPLARIEDTDLRQALVVAEASLATAEARLDVVVEGASGADIASALQAISSAEGQILAAEANLDEVLGRPTLADMAAATQGLLSAQTVLQTAKDDLTEARSNLSVPENLEAVSSGSLDRAIESAELGLAVAQQKYDDTVAGAGTGEIRSAEVGLQTARASLSAAQVRYADLLTPAAPDVVLPLEGSVTQAQIAFENAINDLEAATIVAPFDGVVSEIELTVGAEVNSATVVLVVMNPDALQIDANVDQSDIVELAVGQPATVTFDALPDSIYSAAISAVGLTPEVQQGVVTYPVSLTMDTSSLGAELPAPSPGMTASVLVTTQRVDNALVVPSRAINGTGRQQNVTVKTPAGDEIRLVTTGTTNGTLTEILSGLEPGVEVLVIAATSSGSQTEQTTQQQEPNFIGVPGAAPGGGGGRGLQAP